MAVREDNLKNTEENLSVLQTQQSLLEEGHTMDTINTLIGVSLLTYYLPYRSMSSFRMASQKPTAQHMVWVSVNAG